MTVTTYSVGSIGSTPVTRSTFLNETYTDDIYTFSTSTTNSINLNLHGITSGDDADLYLYRDSNNNHQWDPGDQQLASSRNGSNVDDSINYYADAGNYLARVERYAPGSNGRLDYTLNLSDTSPSNLLPRETEVGALSGSRSFNNQSVSNGDTADTYHFSVSSAGNYRFTLNGLNGDADIRLIRDNNDNRLVDSGEVLGSSTNGGTTPDIINQYLTPGSNYSLEVYQYAHANINYNLTMARV